MTTIKTIRHWLQGVEMPPINVNAQLAEDMRGILYPEDAAAVKLPRVLPATEQLRTNLERAATAYLQREQTLQREIATREAELADVRRARDAATAGLLELEGVPELGDVMATGFATFEKNEDGRSVARFSLPDDVVSDQDLRGGIDA